MAFSSALGPDGLGGSVVHALRNIVDLTSGHPVAFWGARFFDEEKISSTFVRVTYEKGAPTILTKFEADTVPVGDYMLFASPIVLSAEGGYNEALARDAISTARGLLAGIYGHTSSNQIAFSLSVHQDGKISYRSPIIENFELPSSFSFVTDESICELADRMTHFPADAKRRFELAFALLSRAVGEMDSAIRFSHMWFALEVAAGGYGKAEKALADVGSKGLLARTAAHLKEKRRALVHEGRRYAPTQSEERHLCAGIINALLQRAGIDDPKLAKLSSSLGNL